MQPHVPIHVIRSHVSLASCVWRCVRTSKLCRTARSLLSRFPGDGSSAMGGHGNARKGPPAPSGTSVPTATLHAHAHMERTGATSLRQDYLQIAEGVKNGSLRPLEPAAQPVLWNQTNQRFSNHPLNMCSSMSFGEPFDARMRTSASYSFGNCSRNDAKLVYDQARRRLRRAAAPRPDACIVCRRRRSKSARWASRRGHRPPTQSRASSGPSPRSPTRRRPVPSWEPTRATARS